MDGLQFILPVGRDGIDWGGGARHMRELRPYMWHGRRRRRRYPTRPDTDTEQAWSQKCTMIVWYGVVQFGVCYGWMDELCPTCLCR